MIAKDQIINKLELPAISQIGMVVKEYRKSSQLLRRCIGIRALCKTKNYFYQEILLW